MLQWKSPKKAHKGNENNLLDNYEVLYPACKKPKKCVMKISEYINKNELINKIKTQNDGFNDSGMKIMRLYWHKTFSQNYRNGKN